MNQVRLILAQLLTVAMVLAGLLTGFHYDWPDYVHTDYGLPFAWAIHTMSTIIGPADTWSVDTNTLIVDMAIWATLSLAMVALFDRLTRKGT